MLCGSVDVYCRMCDIDGRWVGRQDARTLLYNTNGAAWRVLLTLSFALRTFFSQITWRPRAQTPLRQRSGVILHSPITNSRNAQTSYIVHVSDENISDAFENISDAFRAPRCTDIHTEAHSTGDTTSRQRNEILYAHGHAGLSPRDKRDRTLISATQGSLAAAAHRLTRSDARDF